MPTRTGGSRTWQSWMDELSETTRKWPTGFEHGRLRNVKIGVPWDNTAENRRRALRPQEPDQRRVTMTFDWLPPGAPTWRLVRIVTDKRDRPVDNLAALVRTLEWLRIAQVRGLENISVNLLRKLYPEPAGADAPASSSSSKHASQPPRSTGPHATLHVADDAPLAVAEAAWKALAREAMPQIATSQGIHGNTANERMKALNLAIEAIRKQHGK